MRRRHLDAARLARRRPAPGVARRRGVADARAVQVARPVAVAAVLAPEHLHAHVAADAEQANLILDFAFGRSLAAQLSLGLLAAVVALGGLACYAVAGVMAMQVAVVVLAVACGILKHTAGSKAVEMQKKGADRQWRRPLTELFSLQMVFEVDLDSEDRYLIVASPLSPATKTTSGGVGSAHTETRACGPLMLPAVTDAGSGSFDCSRRGR